MGKAPPNIPAVGDRVQMRGRGNIGTGTLKSVVENLWSRVEWDEAGKAPRLVHLHELEKVADKFTHVLIHRKCGKPAMYMIGGMAEFSLISADDVQYLDGSNPAAGSLPICGSCGEVMEPPAWKNDYRERDKP